MEYILRHSFKLKSEIMYFQTEGESKLIGTFDKKTCFPLLYIMDILLNSLS